MRSSFVFVKRVCRCRAPERPSGDRDVALTGLLADQLVGMLAGGRRVGEGFGGRLPVCAVAAEPDDDLRPAGRDLPELVTAAADELEALGGGGRTRHES